MKSIALLLVAASLFASFETGAEPARTVEVAEDASAQAKFFAAHPDLADERDTVAQAARFLAADRDPSSDETTQAAALAARTRGLLSRRTPQQWQQQAVRLFPELGVAGSPLNTRFLQRHAELQRTSPQFAEEPSWPVLLAKRCADELRLAEAAAAATPQVGLPKSVKNSAAPTPRTSLVAAVGGISVLFSLLAMPAGWLLRSSRVFSRDWAEITAPRRALLAAAAAFSAAALFAMARTFAANADVSALSRFFITLCVSLLTGAAFALPAYAVALAGFADWRKWKTKLASHAH